MGTPKSGIFLLLVLCEIVGHALCQQPHVTSFGDFMEFFLSFNEACKNVTGQEASIKRAIEEFPACTFKLQNTPPKDEFEGIEIICKNKAKYLACWDTFKSDILKSCGANKEPMLPSVYHATVEAVCGSDNGAKRIAELRQAVSETKESDIDNCPEETGIHWLERCKEELPQMNSPNLCNRHQALDTCLAKITCDNVKAAYTLRKMYTDGRQQLRCN